MCVWPGTTSSYRLAVAAPAANRRALQCSAPRDVHAIRAAAGLGGAELERTVNDTGYVIRENVGVDAALRVFGVNAVLFPASANAGTALPRRMRPGGDTETARMPYEKSRALSTRAAEHESTGRQRGGWPSGGAGTASPTDVSSDSCKTAKAIACIVRADTPKAAACLQLPVLPDGRQPGNEDMQTLRRPPLSAGLSVEEVMA